jgi:hypothetical protein
LGRRSGKLEFRERCAGPGIRFNIVVKAMTYRISYEDDLAAETGAEGYGGVTRTEYFRTEHEAVKRARRLIDNGDHHAISVHDSSGRVLTGILLQLKLGAAIVD